MTDDCRRFPIHDATAPIVCTLTAGEVEERRELLGWLRANLTQVDRTEHGMLLHFAPRPEVEHQLQLFATLEKQCCQFWGFDVHRSPGATTLLWDAPPAAQDLVERLLAWFQGDSSIDVVGLL